MAPITVELFDILGQIRRNEEIKNNRASVSVSGLQKDVYILNITIDVKVEGHQVLVE